MKNYGEVEEKQLEESLAWEEVHMEHIVQDEWIDFRRSAWKFPDGSVFEPFYSYSRRDYVVIVASDTDGNYLCVKQFRPGIKQVTTEFPGRRDRTERREGIWKFSEQWKQCRIFLRRMRLKRQKRELLEETGYESDEWSPLLTIPSNATIADNYAHIFMAKNCRKVSGQDLDDTEFLNVVKLPAEKIEKMIETGQFQQAIHITAWLLALRRG